MRKSLQHCADSCCSSAIFFRCCSFIMELLAVLRKRDLVPRYPQKISHTRLLRFSRGKSQPLIRLLGCCRKDCQINPHIFPLLLVHALTTFIFCLVAFCIYQQLPFPQPQNYSSLALVLQIGKLRMLCCVGFAVRIYLF